MRKGKNKSVFLLGTNDCGMNKRDLWSSGEKAEIAPHSSKPLPMNEPHMV